MLRYVESENLIFRTVEPGDLTEAARYRQEFLDSGDSMDGCSSLRRFDNMEDWYTWIRDMEDPATCPPNFGTSTQFISLRKSDGALVGMLDVRHELKGLLLSHFGSLGYSIRPKFRGLGYATEQLFLAKQVFASMGMDKILITCHKENLASARTILKNGGILENEVVDERNGEILQRYWIMLP